MKKIFIILFLLGLSYSCTKEAVYVDGEPNKNLELPLLLNFNGIPCFLDNTTKTLKYSISNDVEPNFTVFVDFQNESKILFNGIVLNNHALNNLGTIEANTPYPVHIEAYNIKFNF